MAQLEDESGRRSPTMSRFTRRPVNALQQGFLPEVNKTEFAPMRGASFRTEEAEEATSDLEHAAAQPTWRPPFLGAWTSRTPSNANALMSLEDAAARLVVNTQKVSPTWAGWWSPAPLSPVGPPSPLSPLARAIKRAPSARRTGGPQPAPLVGGTSPPTTMPHPESITSEVPLSPLARPIRPSVARGGQVQGQMQGQAVTEHAAPAAPLEASLPGTQMQQQQQPQMQPQPQPQQAQPQQAAVSASAVPAEPAVPAGAAAAGPSRGRQSTFVTDEVETVTRSPTLTRTLALSLTLTPTPTLTRSG